MIQGVRLMGQRPHNVERQQHAVQAQQVDPRHDRIVPCLGVALPQQATDRGLHQLRQPVQIRMGGRGKKMSQRRGRRVGLTVSLFAVKNRCSGLCF